MYSTNNHALYSFFLGILILLSASSLPASEKVVNQVGKSPENTSEISSGNSSGEKAVVSIRPPKESWTAVAASVSNQYQGQLVCDNAPGVGHFLTCYFILRSSSQPDQIVTNKIIRLVGGMPAHHHGLPTSPEVEWYDNQQHYQIKGLKFSMPGEWQLEFHFQSDNESSTDKIVFNLTI